MVNSQVVAETVNALKLDIQRENIPVPIPVIDVGIKHNKQLRVISADSSASGAMTVFTTTSDLSRGTLYVKGLTLSYVKNVTCDIASGSIAISATINGVSTKLALLPVLTLNADNASIAVMFDNPVKLDLATVTVTGTFTAGSCVRSYSIYYYLDEVN